MLKKLFNHRRRSGSPVCSTRWSGVGQTHHPTTLHPGLPVRGVSHRRPEVSSTVYAAANPGLPNLNPNGSGPIAPGTVYSTIAKLPGSTPACPWGFREYHLRGLWHTRSGVVYPS